MKLGLRVSRDADRQIDEIDRWWRLNRPSAAMRISDEFLRAAVLLCERPGIGAPYRHRSLPGIRRYRLPRTPYYLYYVADETRGELTILAMWSATRRRGPSIRRS